MLIVIARMEIKPGCMEKFLEVLQKLVPTVRSEDGCIRYDPCRDVKSETRDKFITFVEEWQSAAHHQAHMATSHMAEFRAAAKELRLNSQVTMIEPL